MFKFKQFFIHQQHTPMKVGTDGVLVGAWATVSGCERILDVGSGTGLISLMMAQRNATAKIVGLEVNKMAYEESLRNVEQSPWAKRVSIKLTKLQDYSPGVSYDLVISNPPFFTYSDSVMEENRQMARMQTTLSLGELATHIERLLSPEGRVVLVYPFDQQEKLFCAFEEVGLFVNRHCLVRGRSEAPIKRLLVEFSRQQKDVQTTELVIEHERHLYTEDYIKLTKAFYLKM